VRSAWLIFAKDVRVLARSPALLVVLLAYPLVIAALVGMVASYASSKPRVAFVDEDGLPAAIEVAGHRFDLAGTIERSTSELTLVRVDRAEAERQLRAGRIVALLVIPRGFAADLRSLVRRPKIELKTTRGGLSPRVSQQAQALVYSLNQTLSDAYLEATLKVVRLVVGGGPGEFFGNRFTVIGLTGARELLAELPPTEQVREIRKFVSQAETALGDADEALRATARPVELVELGDRGRTWLLSAQVQAYGLALTISFLALLLAAGSLAAERDEDVLQRLVRGLVGHGWLVAAKAALAALLAALLGLAIAAAFGVIVELGGVEGGQPWERLPLLAVGLLLAGAALGALGAVVGALAREGRTATLAALLFVLPVVFLGLVPREVTPAVGWISDAFPFAHALRFFGDALFELDPWGSLAREAAWLAGLALAYGGVARVAMRRLLA